MGVRKKLSTLENTVLIPYIAVWLANFLAVDNTRVIGLRGFFKQFKITIVFQLAFIYRYFFYHRIIWTTLAKS